MKSIEVKFNEAIEALKKKGVYGEFEIKVPNPINTPLEEQLNRALSVLSKNGVVESYDEKDQWGLTFVESKESVAAARTVTKHNGSDDLFVEGSPFNRERTTNNGGRSGSFFTESAAEVRNREVRQTLEKVDRMIAESWFKAGKITEAEKNKLLGEDKPKGLTHLQETEYGLAVRMGLNESDALSLVKTPLLTEAWR